MKIRPAGPGDVETVVDLRAELWPEGSREEHHREVHDVLARRAAPSLSTAVFVADDDGALLGFVEVGLRSHADGCDPSRPCGFLEGWYVRQESRGRGVGRALVERAEAWAREQGCFEMGSDTWLDNDAAQRTHESLGYEVVDRCVNYRKALAEPGHAQESTPLYGADLAHIHQHHFGQTAEAAARTMLRLLRQSRVTRGTIADLACGGGLLSRRALEAGFDVVGVDQSPHMLELGRSHAEGAHLVQGSLWDVALPPCVAVAAVGEAFNYATDDLVPDRRRLEARFEAIARALAPGGLLLLDVAGPGRSGPTGRREKVWSNDQSLVRLAEVEDAAERQLTRTIETFTPVGTLYRRGRETHRLALFSPEDVAASLERVGFAVERRETYGEPMEALPGWHVFVATRRA